MQRTYGVVWREGASQLATGKLELRASGVRLEGRLGAQDISYTGVSSVHVGRRPEERIDGRPSIVLERFGRPPVTIATVAQPSLVGEIAERLAALQLDAVASPPSEEEDELSFLPTPGPGDSDGGDIYSPGASASSRRSRAR